MISNIKVEKTPKPFIYRRLHSFMGFMLVLFLLEHLITNSQAAYFIGDDGNGFIKSVNFIHNLPYLPVLEILLLGIPFAIHIIWGIKYALESKPNSYENTGITPYLPDYPRNQAYTWQRITSWILILAVLLHVYQMRFSAYPVKEKLKGEAFYLVPVTLDDGLYTLSKRIDVTLYDRKQIEDLSSKVSPFKENQDDSKVQNALAKQTKEEENQFLSALNRPSLKENEGMAVSKNPGTAFLLNIREVFKSLTMRIFYSLFVIFAAFHACNGLFTFAISWGITLSQRSQKLMRTFSNGLMALLIFLGLSAIWFSTLLNLKQ